MTIKDVEKLTGLSAKGIRYYESRGLLRVERGEGNDYRQYTEENVRQLRWIRLLRYLDFSVSQVGEILSADEKTVQARLEERAEEMEKARMDCVMKKNICQELKKDYANPEKRGNAGNEGGNPEYFLPVTEPDAALDIVESGADSECCNSSSDTKL